MHVRNPFDRDETATVRLVVPDGWRAEPSERELPLAALGEASTSFRVTAAAPGLRARVAADVTFGDVRFGQQAEALVDAQ